jgi:hypothetical protein
MDSRKREEQQGKAAGASSPLKHVKMSNQNRDLAIFCLSVFSRIVLYQGTASAVP